MVGYEIIAESGSYIETGQDVGVRKDSLIGIGAGAYDLAGQDTDLYRSYEILARGGFVTKWGINGSEDGQYKDP